LDGIHDKLLFLCLEVKRNFGLDQGDFQSMISGEEVSVAIKHKQAQSVQWGVPGMLFGNELAESWIDASGSMTRRIILVEFNYRVTTSDTHLMDKLKANSPALLHKINMAYRDMVNFVQSSSIWEIVDPYFKETQKRFSAAINPLAEFLEINDGKLFKIEPGLYMPFTDFAEMYIRYTRDRGLRIAMNEDHYRNVFDEYGISTLPRQKKLYRGEEVEVRWLMGVTMIEDD